MIRNVRTLSIAICLTSIMRSTCSFASSPSNFKNGMQKSGILYSDGVSVQVNFEFDPLTAPLIVIRARINGSRPLRLVVDTGLNKPVLLDNAVATEIGLVETSISPGVQAATRQFVDGPDVRMSLLRSGLHGDVNITSPIPVVIGKLPDISYFASNDIAGIIGLPFFSDFIIRLDFQRKTLTMVRGSKGPRNKFGASEIPLTQNERGLLVPVSFGVGADSSLLLDTGSNLTNVPISVGGAISASSRLLTVNGDIKGRFHIATSFLTQAMKVGAFTERNVSLVPVPSGETPVLGTDLLSRFLVTIDLRRKLLILDRTADSVASAGVAGDVGIRLDHDKDGYYAALVKTGSVALSGGVLIGDRILEVDGRQLSGLTWAAAQSLVNGLANRPQTMVIQRKRDERVSVRITPTDPYGGAKSAIVGFVLEWTKESGLRVEDVLPGSDAYQKGLRIGSAVRRINGWAVSGASIDEIVSQLSKPVVKLETSTPSGENCRIELSAE